MKTNSANLHSGSYFQPAGNATSLYQLVNKLQLSLLSQAVNKSFIINIDKSVRLFAEETRLPT